MTFEIEVPDFGLPKLSNEILLQISVGLFLSFVIAEIIGALVSNSLSLLGDAACMSVDIITYICNIYVEWYKNNSGRFNSQSSYTFDIIIPAISVMSLLAVTIYISVDAIKLLMNPPVVDDVNVKYLYAFAAVNLAVDLICGFLYYLRGEEIFLETHEIPKLSLDTSVAFDSDDEFGFLDEDGDLLEVSHVSSSNHTTGKQSAPHSLGFLGAYCFSSSHLHSKGNNSGGVAQAAAAALPAASKKNLNMMSAFTHVLGDTLRTVAVFVAALVSTLTGVDGDICDAWAAVVVTVTIVALCGHIMLEIRAAAVEMYYENNLTDTDSTAASGRRLRGSGGDGSRRGKYTPVHNEDEDAVI